MKLQRNAFRVGFCLLVVLAALFLLPAESIGQSGIATTGTALAASSVYFRLVRLQHGSYDGTVVASDGAVGNIWQSTNNGVSSSKSPTLRGRSPKPAADRRDSTRTVFEAEQLSRAE